MITIIDYGMGNLRSVQKGFEKCGFSVTITRDPDQAAKAAALVVPGVGAFAGAMENLRASGMDQVILEAAEQNRPLLGICLGHQLLFAAGEEWGITEGLGIFPGRVRRLPPGLKIPHMGWNQVEFARSSVLFNDIPDHSAFYFVHSYYVDPGEEDIITGRTEYGIKFASVVEKNYVFGIQFHPEKSSVLGLRILQNFGRLVLKC